MGSHTVWALGVAIGALLVAAYGAYKTRKSWDLRTAISGASAASAGTLGPGQGPVELTGTAHPATYTFTSPLTQQECVAYRLLREEKKRVSAADANEGGSRYNRKWVTTHEEEGGAPFYVDDGSGRTLVDGSTAELDMEKSYEVDTDDVERGVGETVVASVKGLMGESPTEEHEIPQEYVEEIRSSHNECRYHEYVVHEREDVYVYGEAVAPEQTPLGSGYGNEMSGLLGAMSGGVTGIVKGLVGVASDAASDPRQRYKPRALGRLPDDATDDAVSGQQAQARAREQAQQFQQRQQSGGNDGETARQMHEQMSGLLQQMSSRADEAMPETPALEEASVVVSWGERAPTFVVSDQGKKSVVRDYSTGVLGYGLLTVAGAVGAVGAVAWGLGVV